SCSHLHFDHAGGLFTGGGGTSATESELQFPNAEHLFNAVEYAAALHPPEFQKASYRGPFARVRDRGRIREVRGDAEVLPGVRLRHTGGHTEGHQVIVLGGGPEKGVFF